MKTIKMIKTGVICFGALALAGMIVIELKERF